MVNKRLVPTNLEELRMVSNQAKVVTPTSLRNCTSTKLKELSFDLVEEMSSALAQGDELQLSQADELRPGSRNPMYGAVN